MSKQDKIENYEFPDQKIVDVKMDREVEKSFINYAMSVIVSRALPDAKDGLKPVHRRILYSMFEENLTYDRPTYKSAAAVGTVLANYHPHGDASVYDALVRMAQDFSMRYPLIDGEGNFGNIDGDQAAAYRYTEARMSRLAGEMLTDINKNVVDFIPNFDNKRKEPVVLPARFPNLLVNGSVGIAVGMATNIPPHNLGEVVDGVIYLMDHPQATVPELMAFIKGPDFPTAAMICGTAGIREAYETGKGRITVRSRAEVDEEHHRIVVTEIPYAVNKAMMVEAMAACVKDKRIEGITAIRDETGQAGLRVVVEYRHDANGQLILNQLYKYTSLQDTFAVNMLAIVDGVPKILGLKECLEIYIRHQEDVTVRRIRFDLEKALKEAHLFEGYRLAIDNIDRVIAIIRASKNVADAKVNLMNEFRPDELETLAQRVEALNDAGSPRGGLSEEQATAIVEMPLGRLSGLERDKVEDKLSELSRLIKEYREELADEGRIRQLIKDDLLRIKERYGDPRRTEITAADDDIVYEDLIDRHTCVISLTHDGYIKRQNSDVYSAQHRGGKGMIGMTTKDEDFVEKVIAADTHSNLLFFTNLGKVYVQKVYRVPEAGRTAKGSNAVNLLELSEGEKITALISVPGFSEEEYLLFVTRMGTVKRTRLSEFAIRRKGGKIALTLAEGDELVYVRHTLGGENVILATKKGMAVRFDEDDVRVMGRSASGVRGIRLEEGDFVAGCARVEEGKMLVSLTENGFGKRTSFDEYSCHSRGGKGVICHNLNEKTGDLAGIAAAGESDDLMISTDDGTMIRVPVSDLSVYGRSASGVIVMRTDGGKIAGFTCLSTEPEAEIGEADESLDDVENGETESAGTDEE